jgi:hypothetical protein
MARLTTVPERNEVVYEELQTPKQMANTVAQLAIEAAARKVSFVECRDYYWTRLFGSRRTIDVLFRTPDQCS